jgi:hypothetical protein
MCLGMSLGIPHLGMAGWGVFIAPNTKLAVGEKMLLSVAHRTIRWCTRQRTVHYPVCQVVGLTPQTTVGAQAFYIGHSGCYTRQSGGLLSTVPPGTSRWGYCSWCTGQSAVNTSFVSWTSLDLHNVFFLRCCFPQCLGPSNFSIL